MNPNTWKRDETPTHFFNPLKHTVTVAMFDDENKHVLYELASLEISTHPKWLADVLKKHLVDAIINERELGYLIPEKLAEVAKEVEVDL